MRLTVLEQYARGVAHAEEAIGTNLLADLGLIKWLLWHGNQHRAGEPSMARFEPLFKRRFSGLADDNTAADAHSSAS